MSQSDSQPTDVSGFLHAILPGYSTPLSGRSPRDDFGLTSDSLQIWWNNTEQGWTDSEPHFHSDSDEAFVVLEGVIWVDVEGTLVRVGAGEYCCSRVARLIRS